jgi:hypothetical protein
MQNQYSQYGAYVHARPDGSVFYVGKGKEKRANTLSGRTFHHSNVVKKYGAENILVGFMECSTEKTALELEIGLIKCFRRSGVHIVNITSGGEGVSGFKHSQETIERIAAKNRNRVYSPSERKRISDSLKLALSTPEARKIKSDASKRSLNSPEVRVKLSLAQHKLWADPEERAKRVKNLKAALSTPESREIKSMVAKECLSRPEVKAKMSAARKNKPMDVSVNAKISATLKGHSVSEATRAKISASQKIRMRKRRESKKEVIT